MYIYMYIYIHTYIHTYIHDFAGAASTRRALQTQSVVVRAVEANSPAAVSGVEAGDMLVRVTHAAGSELSVLKDNYLERIPKFTRPLEITFRRPSPVGR